MRGRGSANSDEFIREVDEAVRQDRWLKLSKEYGLYFLGGALAIVIGTAGGVAWRHYQESQRLEEARAYAAAQDLLRQDKPTEAADAFAALATQADSGYGVLARLRAAEAKGAAGDAEARTEILERLAQDSAAAPAFRQLGDLLAAQQGLDDTDPQALSDRLKELAGQGHAWRYSALELQALAQLRAGQIDEARNTLSAILGDPGTPPNLSRRAAELMASLGRRTADDHGDIGTESDATEKAAGQSGASTATGEPGAGTGQ
ncbi:MAG: tetratricopeptide repeat protein [Geminicoccaceae bacterium]